MALKSTGRAITGSAKVGAIRVAVSGAAVSALVAISVTFGDNMRATCGAVDGAALARCSAAANAGASRRMRRVVAK